MTHPRVSVCIVTYNQAAYIQDCLAGALAQAEDLPIEILVGDDCSTDGTSAIVEAFAARHPDFVYHWRHPRQGGPHRNYVSLITRARGEFIAHTDGDDYWLPGKLRRQVERLDAEKDLVAVYCNAIAVSEAGEYLGLFNRRGIKPRLSLGDLVRRGNFLNNSSMMYRRELLARAMPTDQPEIDYRLHLRLARQGPAGYLDLALVAYRVRARSSLLVHDNARVREMNWEALGEIPNDLGPRMRAWALASFMRAVCFRATRLRSFALVREWWPRVRDDSPVPSGLLALMTLWCIVEMAGRLLTSALARRLGGNVLYPA